MNNKIKVMNKEGIKRNVGIIVSNLFIFDYLLRDCPKLYLFINNTKEDSYHKGYIGCSERRLIGN
jgi:hypothetical protein